MMTKRRQTALFWRRRRQRLVTRRVVAEQCWCSGCRPPCFGTSGERVSESARECYTVTLLHCVCRGHQAQIQRVRVRGTLAMAPCPVGLSAAAAASSDPPPPPPRSPLSAQTATAAAADSVLSSAPPDHMCMRCYFFLLSGD